MKRPGFGEDFLADRKSGSYMASGSAGRSMSGARLGAAGQAAG